MKKIYGMLLLGAIALTGAGCLPVDDTVPARQTETTTAYYADSVAPGDSAMEDDYSTEADASADDNDDTAMTNDTASGKKPVPTSPVGVLPADRIENKIVRISTAKGEIVFDLLPDQAPATVSNFVALAESGFYDGLTFHRVEPGFVIQGGDPEGTGRGGPGYKFADEPVSLPYDKGIVAMANAGPNTNGSQFFIMLENTPLPPLYTIFGRVTSGQDVVDGIRRGDVMTTVTVEAAN
jgi:cyclophilin family peptidyl-prolyl cis-trans isomerase